MIEIALAVELFTVPVGKLSVAVAMSPNQSEQLFAWHLEVKRNDIPACPARAIESGRIEKLFRLAIEVGDKRGHVRPPRM